MNRRSRRIVLSCLAVSSAFGFVSKCSYSSSTSLPSSLYCSADESTPIQLLSPEKRNEIDNLVQERSNARWNGDYQRADELRDLIEQISITIPLNDVMLQSIDLESDLEYKVVTTDLPRSQGGGSTWELQPVNNPLFNNAESEDNVLQLAHAALGLVVSASERGVDVNEQDLNNLVSKIEARLQLLKKRKTLKPFFPESAVAGELHGRKAADAAFWLSLAGVHAREDFNIYDEFAQVATQELRRFGSKSSCRAKDVLHIVERFAMSGAVGTSVEQLYGVAADCLEVKLNKNPDEDVDVNIIGSLRDATFKLHADRSLLGLWRFSTRQRKQRAFFESAAKHFDSKFGKEIAPQSTDGESLNQYDWAKVFDDPTRPLVVDIGCGMGVSLLGLCADGKSTSLSTTNNGEAINIEWSSCNCIGVDLSRLTIRFARGVCTRWGLDHKLSFIVDPAEDFIERLNTYPGPIQLAMIQFPTPYRYTDSEDDTDSVARGYNAQLPEDSEAGCFMVTEKLLRLIHEILSRGEENGMLLVQSNCEDVAVRMKQIAESKAGFKSVEFAKSVASLEAVTQRAQRWVAAGGKRAIGKSFSALPLLPIIGRTETEVACSLDGKPVHRLLLTSRIQ